MRTITTNVYTYSELPTEAAKAAAREWWMSLEREDPAWAGDFAQSNKAAIMAVTHSGANRATIYEASRDMRWTGFHADQVLADLLDTMPGNLPTICQVDAAYDKAWADEVESHMERAYVEDCLIGNAYEFTEDGKRFAG